MKGSNGMAARIFTVESVEERRQGSVSCWHVVTRAADGAGLTHVFPKVTLEWRAAEYGLTDVDEILNVILHKPHLPEVDQDDAAARAGLVTSAQPDAEPITLFNAASTEDAWTAHRLRIADVKGNAARIRPPDGSKDPLDMIRRNHGMTAHGIRAKREMVDVIRWQTVYGGLPVLINDTMEVSRA